VAVTKDPAGVELIGRPTFQALDFREARRGELRFPDGGPPSLVHAWTPREAVRELVQEVSARYGCPYVVHLEDNEDVITADALGPIRSSGAGSASQTATRFSCTRETCTARMPPRSARCISRLQRSTEQAGRSSWCGSAVTTSSSSSGS